MTSAIPEQLLKLILARCTKVSVDTLTRAKKCGVLQFNGGSEIVKFDPRCIYRVRPAMVSIKWRITTNSIIGSIEFTFRPNLNREP